jgi:hypothetical protein
MLKEKIQNVKMWYLNFGCQLDGFLILKKIQLGWIGVDIGPYSNSHLEIQFSFKNQHTKNIF